MASNDDGKVTQGQGTSATKRPARSASGRTTSRAKASAANKPGGEAPKAESGAKATAKAAQAKPAPRAAAAKEKPAASRKAAKPAAEAKAASARAKPAARAAATAKAKPAAEATATQAKPAPRATATAKAKPGQSAKAAKADETQAKPTTRAAAATGDKPARTRKASKPAATAARATPAPQPKKSVAKAEADLRAAASVTPAVSLGDGADPAPASTLMAENLERIEALTTRLMSALSNRELHDPGVDAPGPEFFMSAGLALTRMWAEQPAKIIEQQVGFWGQTLAHYARAQGQFVRGRVEAEDAPKKDRRFSNPLWDTHPYFNFVKQQYQINAAAMREAAAMLDMPDATGRQRLDWLTNQIVDMFAPTNFLATNPDAIEMALETEGESLVRGLENLVRDVEENNGELVVTLSDREAFKVGENIGTTPGEVVRRAPMYELIQFTPTTDKVHEVPLLIFPPWINKFYILDLKPQNSMIRWLVDQGFTLFVVSWKNADASHADVGLDDYVAAYRDAMAAVCEISGQEQLNAVGYCIGGTTLSLTLGLMAQQGQDMVRTATLFTTLTDFADQGEFTPFLQDDFVSGIESETLRTGYLDGRLMGRTMSFLRANDLVWGPAIRSYLMGQAPPAFDLLYWNGDATNLPGRMTREYLRLLCQQNSLVGDGYPIADKKITLSDVKIPIFAIACETDHIAPWKHSWRGVSQMGSDNRNFILAQSGHIAGIVNPPSKGKYGHYAGSDDFSGTPEEWREQTTFHEGTWWPRWGAWLAENSGKMVAAREPQAGISPAPGTYVHEKAW